MATAMRLREQVTGAASTGGPSPYHAHPVTESYMRLRSEARALAEGARMSTDAFDRQLPEIEIAPASRFGTGAGASQTTRLLGAAVEGIGLLQALEGWLNALIDGL